MFTFSQLPAADETIAAALPCKMAPQEVVEIGLLLPADWALALVNLSRKRHQTVAEILRSMIERALSQGDSSPAR
jgi:hypothetical protein